MHQRVDPPETGSTLDMLGAAAMCMTGLVGSDRGWKLSDKQVVAGVEAAYRLVNQAHAAALMLLAELDSRGLAVEYGASSTQAWLTAAQRMRPGDAKRDVMLAALMRKATAGIIGHDADRSDADSSDDDSSDADSSDADRSDFEAEEPTEGAAVRAGLVAGDLNVDQAGCIATALAELPRDAAVSTRVLAERLLVDEAGLHGPPALTRLGHRILERVDPDAADRRLAETLAREERESRRLRSATRFSDGHGSVFYKLRIPIADDAFIWPVLDTLSAPECSGDNVRQSDPDHASPGGPDPRSPKQRLADAFVEAFRRLSLDGALPSSGGDRPRALITIRLDHLREGVGCGQLVDTGEQLSVSAMRRLCCDALVIPAVLGGTGQVLDVGRARRTFDGPIRLAVIARDGGCIHPGCSRPARWADVHHVIPWWAGGDTSVENGVLLCGFHHRLYDAGTWSIRFAPDHIPECVPPSWIDPTRQPRRHERFHERAATRSRQ